MMSWCRIMRVNLTPRGEGGGHRTSSCDLMEAAWWIHFLPRLQAVPTVSLSLAEGSVTSRPVPGIPGENTASPLQVLTIHLSPLNQFWPSFCFLVLLYFSTSLVRNGETGASSLGNQRSQWFRQPGKRSSSFRRPSTPSELLTFAPLH